METLLKLYKKPYDKNSPVICLDEKPYQLLGDTRKSTLPKPGKIAKQDYEYKRKGTCSIFIAIEPKGKRRYTKVSKRRTRIDFALFVNSLIAHYPKAKIINIVLDNLNTHNEKSFVQAFGEEKTKEIMSRIRFYYTPKHASWLNMAEIEISVLSRQCLKSRIQSMAILKTKVKYWQDNRNSEKIGISWSFTRRDAKNVFKELYV
jgi:transposase